MYLTVRFQSISFSYTEKNKKKRKIKEKNMSKFIQMNYKDIKKRLASSSPLKLTNF